MGPAELMATLDQGVQEGRIAPYLADFIAAWELNCTAEEIGYAEWGARPRATDSADSTATSADLR